MHRICLLPGDGIGPEMISCALRVLRALPIGWDFIEGRIGYAEYRRSGSPLPEETVRKIRGCEAALFGAVTTPPDIPDYFSPVVRMRRALDLFANLRPCRSIRHPSSRPGIDLVIVRENTEGLYSGIERLEDHGRRAVSERVITRGASERIVRKAFELAGQSGRRTVHVVHKANVLRQTCGLFRSVAFEIAKDYPGITLLEMLVDTCAMELVRAPQQFEVIVTTNLFGDILSDEACMLVGGLGLAASGNIGAGAAVFEPVHGSAPSLVGTARANPAATILASAMMLDYLGEPRQAGAIRRAVESCLESGRTTPDLGGELTTDQMTRAILAALEMDLERK
ncbi:MAG TPA: isocitrate/isopropylmalate dehydrogenase family protein [Anaerolineales bacterium]|nr:isocitrate/isopropylmalate dehydrogenase family protein [Anaerolineales bacterium]